MVPSIQRRCIWFIEISLLQLKQVKRMGRSIVIVPFIAQVALNYPVKLSARSDYKLCSRPDQEILGPLAPLLYYLLIDFDNLIGKSIH